MEAVHADVGIVNAVACESDKSVIRHLKDDKNTLEIDLAHLCEWHRILDAMGEFARGMGWTDWGKVRMSFGLPGQPWLELFQGSQTDASLEIRSKNRKPKIPTMQQIAIVIFATN